MSKFLTVINDPKDGPGLPSPLAMNIKYSLDPFQQHAIQAISNNHNVLVTAKTGSGKTLIGEYQIAHSLALGRRVFYTTPIKSLSNQKFYDLKQLFGEEAVGIMTGDIKFKPHASIVVMTTEILRNLLLKLDSSTRHLGISAEMNLDNLDAVVFDEVHYFNNRERGNVWEETIELLPLSIKLVMLSATISGPEKFASWIGNLRQRPIVLITTLHRVVPLHHVVLGEGGKFITIMESTGTYNEAAYKAWQRLFQSKHKYIHILNETLAHLNKSTLLPALVFVFSISMCESYAAGIGTSFTNPSEAGEIQRTFDFYIKGDSRAEFEKQEQFHTLMRLLVNGIAYHHSGLHPKLKEIVELLFSRGLIKVLFCTETFSVGINMPTKTVVFTEYKKPDELTGFRMLHPDEYMQMAGRAGRRGKDKQGIVLYLPSREPAHAADVKSMMTGTCAELNSKMKFGYEFVLKTLQAGTTCTWEHIMKNSYWYLQQSEEIVAIENKIISMRRNLEASKPTPEIMSELDERERLEKLHREAAGEAKKTAQRAYDRWRNSHIGPIWDTAWKTRAAIKRTNDEIITLQSNIVSLRESFKKPIIAAVRFLAETGFLKHEANTIPPEELKTEHLTPKGIMATEINEGNELLVAELYESKLLESATPEDIVAVLASIVVERTDEDSPGISELHMSETVKTTLKWLDETAYKLSKIEERYVTTNGDYWLLSTMWIEPLFKWAQGEEFNILCSDYGIRTGTFMRIILKMANFMEEWIRLATYKSDVEMLEKLKDIQTILVRGIVKPDSLYLRLN